MYPAGELAVLRQLLFQKGLGVQESKQEVTNDVSLVLHGRKSTKWVLSTSILLPSRKHTYIILTPLNPTFI